MTKGSSFKDSLVSSLRWATFGMAMKEKFDVDITEEELSRSLFDAPGVEAMESIYMLGGASALHATVMHRAVEMRGERVRR